MPRGCNPNSRKNLIVNSELTPEERRIKASNAGKASAKARGIKKLFRERLKETMTEAEQDEALEMLKKRAIKQGNLKALEMLFEMSDGKAKQSVELQGVANINIVDDLGAEEKKENDNANSQDK